ncbi:MAG: flagellar export protein FliJ [Gallionellales bacterium RIFCSPLOWO2_12_FULL_59_22]|nr:MAG: flagellar export protein FliJ [Gallionellales bacterium RIFCSPLOWO2_02_FULL_59_110]OGT03085.1 MAG: flagellar export protein FliJ [Gallionellales bacterium RIFCSPLOWO2_02_58_13]OGT10623.1 MAG: flagellar export protein FliJ [Gallionellales bacterium RIFCSPLOWO2_12_FULL_59_22]
MTKPFSLQPIMNLAQHQNDTATRRLGQLNRQQQGAQKNLDTLLEYRKDYQTRLQEAAQNGMNQADLRNFQQFINKLDEAISQQLKQVEQTKAATQAGRSEFDATRRKLESFDTLRQRHVEELRKVAERSEQKTLDEHTGRMAAYRMSNTEDQGK